MSQHRKYDSYGFRVKPKKSLISQTRDKERHKGNYSTVGLVLAFVVLLVIFVFMLISGYISWYCYANDLPSIRLTKTILAAVFFYLYLPYFFLIRVILKTPCLS